MAKAQCLTQDEIDQKKARLEAFVEKVQNDPKRVANKEWLKGFFKDDLDALYDFAADMMINSDDLQKENEELRKKLRVINAASNGISAKIPVEKKLAIAEIMLNTHGQRNPVSMAFVTGISSAKQLRAKQNARKRHEENRVMKADAFSWLDANWLTFRVIDKAAAELIKQQPIAFSTAREWIREWKKLRSPSRP